MAVSNQDVLYALLALDAYNRHFEPTKRKMSDVDGKQLSGQIGTAVFEASSDALENNNVEQLSGSQAAGFSASYYTIGLTKELISYRGT
ncbi:MAG: hypothetical protein GY742_22525, partial [Hyphomicrobiales bacterium]|nr:hypothetical protein [Hyphomicrobiales bacterium]